VFADFYAAVSARRGGAEHRPTFASFEEAHRVTLVIEAIAESHRTRSWVAVGRTETPGPTEQTRTEVVS